MKKVLVMVLAAAFMLAMYVPASAADWDLYGSARMTTFWTDYSEERPANADTTQLNHDLQGNARIGGTVDHGAIGGGFEYGTGVNLRKLYGTVDMGQGQLLIGQDYAPFGAGSFISTQAYGSDNNMLQFVGYTSRQPMVQYSVNGFKIALVKPNTVDYTIDTGEYEQTQIRDENGVVIDTELNQITETTDGNPEIQLPQLQLSYDLMLQGMKLNLAGVVQTYDLDNGDGDSLTAWGLAANARFDQLDPVYVNLGGFYGVNAANFGQFGNDYTESRAMPAEDEDGIEDTDTFGVLMALGTDVENIGLEAGVGYRQSDNDNWDDKDKMIGYYGQATIPLTANGNAFIRPEVGYYDYKDDMAGNDEGDEFYAGLEWRVNF